MPRNEIRLESALFEELAACEEQRPRSWVHYPARSVGRVVLVHNMPLPFRTHWDGRAAERRAHIPFDLALWFAHSCWPARCVQAPCIDGGVA